MAEVKMPKPDRPTGVDDKPVDAVVVSSTRKKKAGLSKWKDVFIAVDKEEFVRSFTENLLYPGLQDLAVRFAHGAIDILFNGRSSSASSWSNPYHRRDPESSAYYRVNKIQDTRPLGKTGAGYSLDEICYGTWDEAMNVLNHLNTAIEEFGIIDVYSFYEWSNQRGDWVDRDWGWEEPISVKPLLNRDGTYFLPLPKPKDLRQRLDKTVRRK